MAARIRAEQNELQREKIQTTQIVKRLYSHVLNEVKMTSTQIRAAEILLRKTMPDLSSIEQQIEVEHHQVRANPLDETEWEQTYGDSLGTSSGSTTLVN